MSTRRLLRRPAVAPFAAAALVALLLGACAGPAGAPSSSARSAEPADCPDASNIALQVNQYLAMQPFPLPPATLTAAGAACSQAKFVAELAQRTGARVAGYKAGLTTALAQQRFGVSQPLRGTLLSTMLVQGGATLPAKFGALPFVESDLVVEVGSAAVNDATTPMQALAALRAVYPFIELPDRIYNGVPTAPAILAANVGARMGVLGTPIPVRNDAAFADALRNMTIRLTDADGKQSTNKGSEILGDPLLAVIWIATDLKRQGLALKPGDLLSLGGYGVGAAAAGKSATVVYEGLPGNPSVTVNFR